MSFKFIHTADWHIAKPFGSFDPEMQTRLRDARIEAIDTIAGAARRFGAADVLVAGDVLDNSGIADDVIRRLCAKLAVHADISWHLLPGNHDAATTGGVWDRAVRLGLPANAALHRASGAVALAPGVVVLAAPLMSRHVSSDLTAWMDDAPTPEGVTRIGLAHGAVQGFGSSGEANAPIAATRADSAGLAYLALGDWHGCKQVGPRAWYSGTPEPDQFPDNEPGFVLAVEVLGPRACSVARQAVAKHTWMKRGIEFAIGDPLAAVEAEIAALGAKSDAALVQLTVTGLVSLGEDQALRSRIEALRPRLMHLDARLDGLSIRAGETGQALFDDPALTTVAVALSARLEAATVEAERRVVRHALRRLGELASIAARDSAALDATGRAAVAADLHEAGLGSANGNGKAAA